MTLRNKNYIKKNLLTPMIYKIIAYFEIIYFIVLKTKHELHYLDLCYDNLLKISSRLISL